MKLISTLVFTLLIISSYSQYSTYYNVYKKVDINQKVNISGNINTIDFGALSLANAQREKNRFENEKYLDEKERRISLEIASDPMKAYEYGEENSYTSNKMEGFKKITLNQRMLNKSLFANLNNGTFENISYDGIRTQILCYTPSIHKEYINLEDTLRYEKYKIGEINEIFLKEYGMTKVFMHKKDLNRATVFSIGGFIGTLIWEDEYENRITDNYQSISKDGIRNMVRVRYIGNKNEIDFEKLEGRRFYLRRVIEKMISSASITDYKIKD